MVQLIILGLPRNIDEFRVGRGRTISEELIPSRSLSDKGPIHTSGQIL